MRNIKAALKNRLAEWRYHDMTGVVASSASESIKTALHWLCLADSVTAIGGMPRAFSLTRGWELADPEATGYIIPTFLALNARFPELKLSDRAWRAGQWLAEVQFESGAICSIQQCPSNTVPSVFNTGTVLHGWVSLLNEKPDANIVQAAEKAVRWLIAEQEPDGSWIKNVFQNIPYTYYTMVDWALIRYAALANDNAARQTAIKHLDWTLRHQHSNGWFDHCWFSVGESVTTHTICYAAQGLVESGRLLREQKYVDAAHRAIFPLFMHFEANAMLPGTFNEEWQPTADWECCTGTAQASLVLQALATSGGDRSLRRAAQQLNQHMLRYQKTNCRMPALNGAIPGSWPISGDYDRYSFPTHAAKFHIDGLLGVA